jgi:hypothetical protein
MRVRCTVADVAYEVDLDDQGQATHVSRWVGSGYGTMEHTRTLWSAKPQWKRPIGKMAQAAVTLARQLRTQSQPMSNSPKPVMIFGKFEAARVYAHQRGLTPSQWSFASCREKVMGLDPAAFETVIAGPLDDEGSEALREWEFRREVQRADQPT